MTPWAFTVGAMAPLLAAVSLLLAHVGVNATDRGTMTERQAGVVAMAAAAGLSGCSSDGGRRLITGRGRPPRSRLLQAAATLEQSKDAAGRRRVAMVLLAAGRRSSAIEQLQTLLENREDADGLSDLSTAHIESALQDGTPGRSLVLALDAAARAIAIDDSHSAAHYNMWFAATALRLPVAAAQEMRRARTSPCWGRGVVLAAQVDQDRVNRHQQYRRVTGELLFAWARSVQERRDDDQGRLSREAQHAAAALAQATGDRFPSDLVRDLVSDSAQYSKESRSTAWLAYLEALSLLDEERYGLGAARLREAARLVDGHQGALGGAIELELASSLRLEGRSVLARDRLECLLQRSKDLRHFRLAGRAAWYAGLLWEEAGFVGAALARYGYAVESLEAAADLEGLGVSHIRLARTRGALGELTSAWESARRGMDLAGFASRMRQDAIWRGVAVLAETTGLAGAALTLQSQALAEAYRVRSPVGLAFLLNDRARYFARLNEISAARAALDEAERWEALVPEPALRDLSMAARAQTVAMLDSESEPELVLARLTEALGVYEQRRDVYATATIQLERARLLRRLGRLGDARASLSEAIAQTDRAALTLQEELRRSRVASVAWPLVTELADLELGQSGPGRAVQVLEAHRPKVVRRVRALEPVPFIVAFFTLPSASYAMVLDKGRESFYRLPCDSATIQAAVSRYHNQSAPMSSVEARRLGASLFELLFGQFSDALSRSTAIAIVPDATFASLPYAALVDPATDRPLLVSHRIVLAPSIAAAVQARPLSVSSSASAVVVGDPVLSREAALPQLPAARDEAVDVASSYRTSKLLLGRQATRDAVAEAMQRSTVMHFAGHAVVDQHDLSMSRLLVAPAIDDALGALFEGEIAQYDLSGVRLVVLAACRTVSAVSPTDVTMFGFASTFLGAGAKSVVGTLWPVDDDNVSRVFVDFHGRLVRGRPIEDALREAQLAAIDRGVSWQHWAGLAVIVSGESAQDG